MPRESVVGLLARCWDDPDPSVRWLARITAVMGALAAVVLLLALVAIEEELRHG